MDMLRSDRRGGARLLTTRLKLLSGREGNRMMLWSAKCGDNGKRSACLRSAGESRRRRAEWSARLCLWRLLCCYLDLGVLNADGLHGRCGAELTRRL